MSNALQPMNGKIITVGGTARFTSLRVIGAGAFGQVLVGEDEQQKRSSESPSVVVVKRVHIQGESEKQIQAAAVEVKVLQGVESHPNLVAYKGHVVDDDGYLDIAMEYCPFGDLDRILQARREAKKGLGAAETLFCCFQILQGVAHLHRFGVMHRDLKPGNILVAPLDENGVVNSSNPSSSVSSAADLQKVDLRNCLLKVSDFGISRVMQNTLSFANTVIGTPFYLAPEIVEGKPYSTSADLWAVGCIFYEIATCGVRCFTGGNMLAVANSIANGRIPPFPTELVDPFIAERLMSVICDVVVVDPSSRLTAEALLKKYFLPPLGPDPTPADVQALVDEFEEPPS